MSEPLKPDAVLAGRKATVPAKVWAREGLSVLPNLAKLLGRLMLDPRVPTPSKVLLGVTVGYVVSPLDILPDFIPFFGHLDELLLMSLALHYLLRSVEPDIVLEHWDGSEDMVTTISSVVDVAAELVPTSIRNVLENLLSIRTAR